MRPNAWKNTQPVNYGGQKKRLKIAHLNAESLKNRTHFHEVRELAAHSNIDILTISETWPLYLF